MAAKILSFTTNALSIIFFCFILYLLLRAHFSTVDIFSYFVRFYVTNTRNAYKQRTHTTRQPNDIYKSMRFTHSSYIGRIVVVYKSLCTKTYCSQSNQQRYTALAVYLAACELYVNFVFRRL